MSRSQLACLPSFTVNKLQYKFEAFDDFYPCENCTLIYFMPEVNLHIWKFIKILFQSFIMSYNIQVIDLKLIK